MGVTHLYINAHLSIHFKRPDRVYLQHSAKAALYRCRHVLYYLLYALAGGSFSLTSSRDWISFSKNVRHCDGCENDMSLHCTTQHTSDLSRIRPATHVRVYKDLAFLCMCLYEWARWLHCTVGYMTYSGQRKIRRIRLISHTEEWHNVLMEAKVMWMLRASNPHNAFRVTRIP